MAAREVIHFPFGAQLSTRPEFRLSILLSRLRNPCHEATKPKTRPRRGSSSCARCAGALAENRKEGTVRTDMYTELYLWNKNVDSSIRVLQRLEALRILAGQSLNECEIRLEELRCALNVGILEAMLTREQTDYWRLSRQRETLDDARRNDFVQ